MILIALSLHVLLWHLPLFDLGALKTPEQDENFSDQNFYLYVASNVCRLPDWTADDITVTWSSAGVIGYLTYGCQIFGSEYFYIVLNPLLVALSIAGMLAAARDVGLQAKISLVSIMALPYTYLTLSLPGKEILSVVGTMMCVAGLMLVEARKRSFLGLLSIAAGLAVIGSNRMHEAGAISAFVVMWLTGALRSPWRLALVLAAGSYLAGDILAAIRLNENAESLTDEVLWSGSSEGKAVDLDSLFNLLRADNLVVHSLLGIFRVAAVLASPLSSLVTPWTDTNFSYFVFRDLSQRLRLVDMMFIVYVLIRLFRTRGGTADTDVRRRLRLLMPSLFFFMIYVISFFGVSQKSRYIFQYTPLLLAWLWLFDVRCVVRRTKDTSSTEEGLGSVHRWRAIAPDNR